MITLLAGGARRLCVVDASLLGRWARLGGRQHGRCLASCIRPLAGVFFRTGLLFPRGACLLRRLNWLLAVAAGGGLLFLGRLALARLQMILVRLFTL